MPSDAWPPRPGKSKEMFLPFDRFQLEVSVAYGEQEGNVKKWYAIEHPKHYNWPPKPDEFYKEWPGWPELVFKENRLKKWMPFDQFKTEVRALYTGTDKVREWYEEEQKKHTETWPSTPWRTYKGRGWSTFSELVGKFLPFPEFQAEVRTLYPGSGDINEWYRLEQTKHSNWPSNPNQTYEDAGWEGLPELVGKKNRLKKHKSTME